MSSYGGNLTLKHVQQVFPKKSKGEQVDIHDEFGESTNNAEELKAAILKSTEACKRQLSSRVVGSGRLLKKSYLV